MSYTGYIPPTMGKDVVIGPNVKFGTGVKLHDGVQVGYNSVLDDGVEVFPNAVIGAGAKIGIGTSVGADAQIADGAWVGNTVQIGPNVYVGNARIHSLCVLEPYSTVFNFAEMEEESQLKERATLNSFSHLGRKSILGEGVGIPSQITIPPYLDIAKPPVINLESDYCIVALTYDHIVIGSQCASYKKWMEILTFVNPVVYANNPVRQYYDFLSNLTIPEELMARSIEPKN